MKLSCFILLLLSAFGINAQKIEQFYDYQWHLTDNAHARFYSVIEHTDSGWHRLDYYLRSKVSLQMEGWYEDSACKIATGKFTYVYPDKKIESIGRYLHNKKQGLWLTFHYNGVMSDSTVYDNDNPIGTSLSWHPNGYTADSAVYAADGSGVHVSWFDNGNPSSGGMLARGFKKQGKWKFYHKNGMLSAIELYDRGWLVNKQYLDEAGQGMTDTTNKDKSTASFKGGTAGWLKYIGKHLYFPDNFRITNSDMAAVIISATIDEDGNVQDVYVSTPFYPAFEKIALDVVRHSPKWEPAMEHNRRIRYYFRQPVIFSQPAD